MNPLDINQMSKNNKDLNVFTWSKKLSYQIVGQTASNMFIIIASNTAIQFSAIIFLFFPLRQNSSYTRVIEYSLDVRNMTTKPLFHLHYETLVRRWVFRKRCQLLICFPDWKLLYGYSNGLSCHHNSNFTC